MKNFFMVFVEGERSPVFKHETRLSAEREALRLASLTGRETYILMTICKIQVNISLHVDEQGNEMPF